MSNFFHKSGFLHKSPVRVACLTVLPAVLIAALLALRPGSRGSEWEWYERGIQATKARDIAEAVKDFERAIEINPKFAPAYDVLAASYFTLGRVDRTLETLDRVRVLKPEDAYISTRISETYAPVDNVYMLRWAREAILQDPRQARAHILLALGLARSGDSRDALQQAMIGEQLAHSSLLETVMKGNPSIAAQPDQLALTLRSLAVETPYQ